MSSKAASVVFTALNAWVPGVEITPHKKIKQLPVAIYSITEEPATRSKGTIHFRNYGITIRVHAATYTQCQSIANQIMARMEAIQGTTVATHPVRFSTSEFAGESFDEDIGYTTDLNISLTLNA